MVSYTRVIYQISSVVVLSFSWSHIENAEKKLLHLSDCIAHVCTCSCEVKDSSCHSGLSGFTTWGVAALP